MQYADKVLPLMRDMRDFMRSQHGVAEAVHHKSDSAWSIVTQMDLDIESIMRSKLAIAYPTVNFVGEESGGDRTKRCFWLMDPIDGTAHYARGLPFCTSMLACIEEGQVVFGVIYDFLNDNLYWAERGMGAYLNNERIRVSERSLKQSFVSFETNVTVPSNARLFDRLRAKTDVLKTFCAGWEFAMVASGKYDGRICYGPYGNDYDYAPGSLLVSEAGGIVANIGTTTYDYKNLNFIAANKIVYRDLTEGENAVFPFRIR